MAEISASVHPTNASRVTAVPRRSLNVRPITPASGGYRTVTYYAGEDVPVLMLALINKGERADLSQAERNELRKELAGYAEDYRTSVRRRVQAMKRKPRE